MKIWVGVPAKGSDVRVTLSQSHTSVAPTVTAAALAGTLKLSLNTSGCGNLPASASGVLVVDAAYAPVAFRLLADNGTQVVDLWAYAE